MKKTIGFLSLMLSFACSALELKDPAPACEAKLAANNQSFDPKTYLGKVVVVDFWATWCPPCIKSIPFFNKLKQENSDEHLELIAINVDEDHGALEPFMKDHPIHYSLAYDPEGNCPKSFDVKAMPSSYIIDKNGLVQKIHLGYREEDQAVIKSEIERLLKQ